MPALRENDAAALSSEAAPAPPLAQQSLARRVVTVLFGNGLYMAGGFLANVLLANVLAPREFGYFSVAMTVMLVAQEICGTGFDLAMVRLAGMYVIDNPARARAIVELSLRVKVLVNGAIALLLVALAGWLSHRLFEQQQSASLLYWAAAGVMGTTVFQHILARFQCTEHFRAYAVLRSTNSLGKLALFAALAWLGALDLDSALAVTVLVLFVSFLVGILMDLRAAPRPASLAMGEQWRELFWFGRWMIASHLLFSLYARLDILFLGWLRSETEVGYYSVAWNLGFLIDLCTFSFITALLPRAARMQRVDQFWAYCRETLRACALMAVALLPMWLGAEYFIKLVFPAYTEAVAVFRVLFWGCVLTLLTHPLYLVVYARNRVSQVALSNLVLALVTGIGCWFTIPIWGALGAAYATVGARVINSVFVIFLVGRELRTPDAPGAGEPQN